jgi:murein DD-endopeptidase MepM/ murein hydrolase activator NlpD
MACAHWITTAHKGWEPRLIRVYAVATAVRTRPDPMYRRHLSPSLCCLALLLMQLSAQPALAVAIYKFRDANGVVTFTDKPTRGAQVLFYGDRFIEKLDSSVRIEKQPLQSGEMLTLINDLYAPVEVELTIKDARNIESLASSKIHRILPARSKTPLLTLHPRSAGKMSYRHSLRFALSDPKQAPSNYNYALPWSNGQYKVTQGPGGRFSHQDAKGRHAVDVSMPEGTRVTAARAGTVVSIDQNERAGNGSRAGNYVRVLHSDGTMSVYLHLRQQGVLVKEGQFINVGDLIAYSGNTGHSTGAHLHFVVQKNVGMNVVSIPFKFESPEGIARIPKAGDMLGNQEVATR